MEENKKEMKELWEKQFLGVISILITLLISITGYAYYSDIEQIETNLGVEINERKIVDEEIKKLIIRLDDTNQKAHQSFTTEGEFEEYKNGILLILEYIKSEDKEKRELLLKIEEMRGK